MGVGGQSTLAYMWEAFQAGSPGERGPDLVVPFIVTLSCQRKASLQTLLTSENASTLEKITTALILQCAQRASIAWKALTQLHATLRLCVCWSGTDAHANPERRQYGWPVSFVNENLLPSCSVQTSTRPMHDPGDRLGGWLRLKPACTQVPLQISRHVPTQSLFHVVAFMLAVPLLDGDHGSLFTGFDT